MTNDRKPATARRYAAGCDLYGPLPKRPAPHVEIDHEAGGAVLRIFTRHAVREVRLAAIRSPHHLLAEVFVLASLPECTRENIRQLVQVVAERKGWGHAAPIHERTTSQNGAGARGRGADIVS
jgi:hypothetical protein